MTNDPEAAIKNALSAALAHYEETMGEAFPVVPELLPVADDEFWAVAEAKGDTVLITVSTGIVQTLTDLWNKAADDTDLLNGVGNPFQIDNDEMVHLGLVWHMLHELHHFQMGHFAFTGKHSLTEANAPKRYGVAQRDSTQPSAYDHVPKEDWPNVEPCLELQADHDAMEMLIDAYSPNGWDIIRTRTAAMSAMMMLIEREDAKRENVGTSHPKAATRIFQLLGHVIEMPLIQAKLAQEDSELNIDPAIPSDEEQAAYNREVTISSFFDAVNLARIAEADTIREDLGEAQYFFQDLQVAKLCDPVQFKHLMTDGAYQWSCLIVFNELLSQQPDLLSIHSLDHHQ